ncbi:sensor histidine kinase [Paenibacillus whitsoniae]|uniref:Sensor histidine kinase n=1 Tax=Paenibacillus whitsoniae TaxID=2496558 RepID=A0A430JBC7_9BACL|nr:sensor histidine kinase [Paenibacillus whitsoniae]RTE08321.1 sensor histidine kinase [Paenibacillus whitsoniae]
MLLLTILSIALTGGMSYWIAFRSTEQGAFISSQNTLNKSARILDEKLRHIIVTTSSMMLSDAFKQTMEDVAARDTSNYYTRLSALQTPLGQMKLIEPSIQSVLISTPIGEMFATNDLRSQTRLRDTVLNPYLDSNERVMWVKNHEDLLFYGRQEVVSLIMKPVTELNIRDVNIVVNVKEEALRRVVTDDLLDNASEYFLIAGSGEIVLPINGQKSAFQKDPSFLNRLQVQDRGFFKYSLEDKAYLVNFSRLTLNKQWTMVSLQTQADLLRQVNRIKTITLIIMLCCIVLAFVLSNVIASVLLKPLHKLQGLMRKVENNHLDVRFESRYQDEVAQVGLKFNRMLEEIASLIENVKEAEFEKRKMEVKALQAQIDPHFLYNTLNTILWKSESAQNQDVTEMITSLSMLFQLGLNGGNEMTTLNMEIDHVRQYLIIQQKCYEDLFEYTIELEDDSLLEEPILKILLQPLVENTILHGFQEMERKGFIKVSIARSQAQLRLTVEDNGAGMNVPSVMANMKQEHAEAKSYALRNVYGRLRLHYGHGADIVMHSEPYISTSVTLIIPFGGEGGPYD